VQTVSFNLRVFSSILGERLLNDLNVNVNEPFRNDSIANCVSDYFGPNRN
jgi:hypothetical protein